ncbi:MAG TPA: cobalamin-binding protein [Acidobacteriaceae bacterium]|jgi:iron complex transport system substrate-binding protein|nr:cobalamin-binding protein [Acidobacteriaceae bacterium]
MRRVLLIFVMLMAGISSTAQASRVVTDETGRKVTVPDHPHRVICLVPSITDTVFALGSGDDVVAVSDYTTYPAAALKKPSIGSLVKPSVETILSFHPDLVVGSSIPGSTETATQLKAVGVPVYLVDPQGLSGILRSVKSVGQALNRVPQAAALDASLSRRIAAVKARTAGKPAPRVLVPVWYDPIITIGKHAFISEIVEVAGAKSVTDDLIPDWPQISMETVIARAPEALLLIRGGKLSIDMLRKQPGWSSLPAIQNDKVYYVDNGIQEPSPVAIDALEELAKEFHP